MKQEIFVELIKNNTEAMNKVANAVEVMNDQNAMHYQKDGDRDTTLKELVSSSKAIQKIFYIVVCALIVIAGAEKALGYVKIFSK